jgi:hypothetical protein
MASSPAGQSKNALTVFLLVLPIIVIAALIGGFVVVQQGSTVTTITTVLTRTVTNTSIVTTTLPNGSTQTSTITTSTVVTVTSMSTLTLSTDTCSPLATIPNNATNSATNATSGTRPVMGMIVPLYGAPGCEWSQLMDIRQQYPTVPVIAIINPSNGSGTRNNTMYVTWIQKLQRANITVIGYVNTAYGKASESGIRTNITNYVGWYHINGIFFDEMGNTPGKQEYYSSLTQYAHSLGASYVVGDPGTSTLPSYLGTVDNLMIFENPFLANVSVIEKNTMGDPSGGFSFVAYEVSQLPSQAYFNAVARYVSWVLVSDTNHSFRDLPSYLPQEMQELSAVTASK